MTDATDSLKRAAAREALTLVEDGMIVGLGSGTTSELFLEALAERVAAGLRITGRADLGAGRRDGALRAASPSPSFTTCRGST